MLLVYFRNNIFILGFADGRRNILAILNAISLLGANSTLGQLTGSHAWASPAFPVVSQARIQQAEYGLILT